MFRYPTPIDQPDGCTNYYNMKAGECHKWTSVSGTSISCVYIAANDTAVFTSLTFPGFSNDAGYADTPNAGVK